LCAYSIQNVNSYEPVSGPAQYHTVLISQHWDFMLVTFMYFRILIFELSVSVAARSKAKVCGCSHAEIVGSNPTGGTDVLVVIVVCCHVEVSETS